MKAILQIISVYRKYAPYAEAVTLMLKESAEALSDGKLTRGKKQRLSMRFWKEMEAAARKMR